MGHICSTIKRKHPISPNTSIVYHSLDHSKNIRMPLIKYLKLYKGLPTIKEAQVSQEVSKYLDY